MAGQTGGQNQTGQTEGQTTAGQTEGQGQTGQAEGQVTAGQTEGQATAGQAEGQATAGQTEGQATAGQTEGQARRKARPWQARNRAPPAQPENPLQVNYSAFIVQQGWSAATADNHPCAAGAGSWVTAMRANLINIPQGAQVGIRYQVNLSGSGWLSWSEDGAEAGGADSVMPLESIRMELTGSAASDYDLYYWVLQNGSWTDWAANGSASGVEGAGLRVDGIRASITAKGAGLPAEPVLTPGISSSIDPSRPMIALTFDDGPKTSVTSRILDSLEANGGRGHLLHGGFQCECQCRRNQTYGGTGQ